MSARRFWMSAIIVLALQSCSSPPHPDGTLVSHKVNLDAGQVDSILQAAVLDHNMVPAKATGPMTISIDQQFASGRGMVSYTYVAGISLTWPVNNANYTVTLDKAGALQLIEDELVTRGDMPTRNMAYWQSLASSWTAPGHANPGLLITWNEILPKGRDHVPASGPAPAAATTPASSASNPSDSRPVAPTGSVLTPAP